MGLAFAAMALALGRLGMIDHIFNKYAAQLNNNHNNTISTELKTAASATDKDNHDVTKSSSAGQSSILASQICWSISIGSFGYGIFRYVSVRRTLIQGQFVPAIWGPVLMTTCSLGLLATLLRSGKAFQRHESRN